MAIHPAREHAGLAALAAGESARSAPLWATLVAGLLPLSYYVATASAFGYWLDAGEFVATARTLGISHPPGQPLTSLFDGAFALLPLGPLSFRVAVGSAVAAATAVAFSFRAIYHTLVLLQLLPGRARAALSLAAALWLAAGVGVWLQAVRPEVYALQAALAAVSLDGVVRYERDAGADLAALYVAAFAEGLALANHHFLALLLLPAAAPSLARALLRHGVRALVPAILLLALGLAAYLYLPLRAQADPIPNFGDPTDLERLYWVVSAKAFQTTHALTPAPLSERMADVGAALVESLGWPLVLAAVGGLYLAFREPGMRRAGVLWGLVFVLGSLGRAWLGFVRHNPDALGYLIPAYLALIVFAALFTAALLAALPPASRRTLTPLICGALLVTSVWRLEAGAARADLSRFDAVDVFDRYSLRRLPEHAVVLLHDPQSIFRSLGARVERSERPDLTVVPLPLLTYPGMVEGLLERLPALRPVLRGYLLEGRLRQPDLQTLASERPVFVELDPRVPQALYETLVPAGLLHEVLADGATERDEREAARQAQALQARLYADLGPPPFDPRTRERLLWLHYTSALYYMGFGDAASAAREIALGLAHDTDSAELRAMQQALEASEAGPIDVTPFRMGEGPDHRGPR